MLRYSMSRKNAALVYFPKELVQQLTADLAPLDAAGFLPVKVEVILEVSGPLQSSGALIPIKDLNSILSSALSAADSLQSNISTYSDQLWASITSALSAWSISTGATKVEASSLELVFENDTSFKQSISDPTLTVRYPLSFQHAVDFDLGPAGERLHHGHDSKVDIAMAMDAQGADRFVMQCKPRLDATMAATGEMIVKAIAESINESEFKQEIFKVSLQETEKNAFSATFDRPRL